MLTRASHFHMLRQLWSGGRNPARTLANGRHLGSFCRPSQLRQSPSCQRHFLSRANIRPPSPQTNNYRQDGEGPPLLHGGIHGTVILSLCFFLLNYKPEYYDSHIIQGENYVYNIARERDPEKRTKKLYEVGDYLLSALGEVENHGRPFSVPEEGDVDFRVLTAPNPRVKGGKTLLCLVPLRSLGDQTRLDASGNRFKDVSEAMIPKIEAFAGRWPGSRGAMLILDETGDWMTLLWDGKKWLNIAFLEWQSEDFLWRYGIDL
ncbi:hypothetical protein F4802DRAFT_565955 [Xylaria palmicola]|nr:hypothetical protein F4802DRAFT_565955 [Xylaria palmicola]